MIPVKEITLTRREGRASLCDHPYVARATARRTRGLPVHQIAAFTAVFGIQGNIRAITRNYRSPQTGWCTAAGRIAGEPTPDAYIAAPAPPGGRRYVR